MHRVFVSLLVLSFWTLLGSVQRPSAPTLDAYQIDVEGGEATLFVSPSGESLLVDAGWLGYGGRDADRIAAAARQAGVTQIDHLVVTHYHTDHAGGAAELAARMPIRHCVDHGSDIGEDERAVFESYSELRRQGRHTEARPGDAISVAGLSVKIIASGGSVLGAPLEGRGGSNPLCDSFRTHGPEITGRAADGGDRRSVSLLVGYEKFRTIIMGDLTWNKEFDLVCPGNKLGTVDVYFVSHHGSDTSGSAAFVHPLRPRVAIMNNGPRKGGAIQTFQILRTSPGLEDLWQNHYSVPGGAEHNPADAFIANLEEGVSPTGSDAKRMPVHMGAAAWIKLSARPDGSFTVTNSRTGFSKSYPARN